MSRSKWILFLCVLFLPALIDAQEISRGNRSLEEHQAISHISQAEYYARMALRSLEASETIGKAPYFNYQSAREDVEKVISEFRTYLKGDESADLPPAMPLIVDGRYAESIRDFLATRKADEAQTASNLRGTTEARPLAPKTTKNAEAKKKKNVSDNVQMNLKQNAEAVLPPPMLAPQGDKARRDKIEAILKKGL